MKIFKAFIATLVVSMVATSTSAITTLEQTYFTDRILANSGYYPTGDNDLHGVLDDSSSTRDTVYFSYNKSYAITGVCDRDCSDIDVFVYDKYGDLVAEDDDTSDMAVATFKASYSGNYTIKVTMYDCSTADCYYRVRSYVGR